MNTLEQHVTTLLEQTYDEMAENGFDWMNPDPQRIYEVFCELADGAEPSPEEQAAMLSDCLIPEDKMHDIAMYYWGDDSAQNLFYAAVQITETALETKTLDHWIHHTERHATLSAEFCPTPELRRNGLNSLEMTNSGPVRVHLIVPDGLLAGTVYSLSDPYDGNGYLFIAAYGNGFRVERMTDRGVYREYPSGTSHKEILRDFGYEYDYE